MPLSPIPPTAPVERRRKAILVAIAVGLFLIWSNSFIAVGYLVGSDHASPRLDWVSLVVARFLPAALLCGLYAVGLHWRETVQVVRRHGWRLLASGAAAVPGYNLALYYGQQHGVPAPIASLTTALLPLFVLLLAALLLGEALTRQRLLGFAIATVGMLVVALARPAATAGTYGRVVAITALAPLSWSLFTVLSKPVAGSVRPLLWTFLSITVGGLLVLPLLPWAWDACVALDGVGWLAVAYLSLPSTVIGFAVWTWLLGRLPASTVGFTVFLNPPMTTLSKLVLAALWPATFVFAASAQELVGGGLALVGLVVATRARS